jgi:hypothetical protein
MCGVEVKLIVGNINDFQEIWFPLDVCYEHPKKYIMEALQPIVNFKRYKAFDNMAIRGFYSLLRATIMGAKSVSPSRCLSFNS